MNIIASKLKVVSLLICIITVTNARATGFTVLHPFASATGAEPHALLLISNTLYGTALQGGSGKSGALYKMNTDGTGYTNFFNFVHFVGNTNSTGSDPVSLLFFKGALYGAASEGGAADRGTLFRVNTDGTGFTNLHTFSAGTNSEYHPGPLVISENVIYGATSLGSPGAWGTLFRVNPDGTGFTNLLDVGPEALVASSNALFGVAYSYTNYGNIFMVNKDGTGFTNLYTFSPTVFNGAGFNTNGDGADPNTLLLSGNTLYGTASQGGANGNGTLFKINTDGTGFTVLYSFSATPEYVLGSNDISDITNSDGANPDSLVLRDSVLYGAASGGGAGGVGTLFQINVDGCRFETLYSLGAVTWLTNVVGTTTYITYTNTDGLHPAGLLLNGRNLYGTAPMGGAGNAGTLFDFRLPLGSLNLASDGTNLVLQWDDPTCCLQWAPTPAGSWTDMSGIGSPCTNAMCEPAGFFRLKGTE